MDFHSKTRAPAKYAVTMLGAIWVCGPGAGPRGFAAGWPHTVERRSMPGRGQ